MLDFLQRVWKNVGMSIDNKPLLDSERTEVLALIDKLKASRKLQCDSHVVRLIKSKGFTVSESALCRWRKKERNVIHSGILKTILNELMNEV